MSNIKKEITFFYDQAVEKVHWGHLDLEAVKRGYSTCFSKNMNQKAEIGFYLSDQNKPENSKLSFVMLHGMDQGRTRWPNIWRDWPWHKFDIGLLPGKTWSDRWKKSAFDPYSHPRIAVCEVGSPKADEIFSNKSLFQERIDELKRGLNLPFDKTVLYAPTFETDNKQKDLMDLLRGTQTNLLIKHWIYPEDAEHYPDFWNNVKDAHNSILSTDIFIKILPPDLSIMTCLGLSDILVTDESSVAYEALLLDRPSFTFNDWVMRTNNQEKARPVKPVKDIVKGLSKKQFHHFITNYSKNADFVDLDEIKKNTFSHLGTSASVIVDIIDAVLANEDFGNVIVSDQKSQTWLIPQRHILRLISKLFPKKIRDKIRMYFLKSKIMRGYFGDFS